VKIAVISQKDNLNVVASLLKSGNLYEIYFEKKEKIKIGDIYLGKVIEVVPGLGAAFIEIGKSGIGFLKLKEIPSDNIRPGDKYIVQIGRKAIGQKYPQVTMKLSIPGRYIILMPFSKNVGVSRKVESKFERDRLYDIIKNSRPKNMGLIARTAAEGVDENSIAKDIKTALSIWTDIIDKSSKGKVGLLRESSDTIESFVRDRINSTVDEVIVDTLDLRNRVGRLFKTYNIDTPIRLHSGSKRLLDFYRIMQQFHQSLEREIFLPSGGFITIEKTEALTVIDVNSGSYLDDDVIFKTNFEAAIEIARIIRLRDIGGIIIIDFISMTSEKDKELIVEKLKAETKYDYSKSIIFGFTHLGLLEMSRKKLKEGISKQYTNPCPYCRGKGYLKSFDVLIKEIENEITPYMKNKDIKSAEIKLSKYLYDYTKIINLKYNNVDFKLDLSLMPEEYNIKFTKR
jgi:ribonuclease G